MCDKWRGCFCISSPYSSVKSSRETMAMKDVNILMHPVMMMRMIYTNEWTILLYLLPQLEWKVLLLE